MYMYIPIHTYIYAYINTYVYTSIYDISSYRGRHAFDIDM